MINISLAITFEQGRISTTGGADIEKNELLDKISTIRRLLTIKNVSLLSHNDKIDENEEIIAIIKQMVNVNHNVDANEGEKSVELPLEYIFCFCRSSNKVTKR